MALRWLVLVTALMWSRVASADVELWHWFEYRMPVASTPGGVSKLMWRVNSDTRFNVRNKGLHLAFLRVGPMVEVNRSLMLAFNAVAMAERLPNGSFTTEYRAEIEPWLQGRFGPLQWQDRNRLEVRFRTDTYRLRYRNLLRFNWAPEGARSIPYIWDEVMVDLSGEGNHQNRLTAGVGILLWHNVRLDFGLMLRTRRTDPTWTNDVVSLFSLFVGPPKVP